MVKRVAIEGNIASGKTTLLDVLSADPIIGSLFDVIIEPLAKWQNCAGQDLLARAYTKNEGFHLQSRVTYTMITRLNEAQKPFQLIERSISSARIFGQLSLDVGRLSLVEFTILNDWYEFCAATNIEEIALTIYLQTDPAVSHERLKKRGRPGEQCVTLDYLNQLHRLHDATYANDRAVVIVDGNLPAEDVAQLARNAILSIVQ